MKVRIHILSFVFGALSISALAQCSNSTLKPVWDADKTQFRCINPNNPGAVVKDGGVVMAGDKSACGPIRENLQAACPVSNEGKACRNEAKSLFNACKRSKSDSESSSADTRGGSRTDSSTCMTTFQQQQQTCASHKSTAPAPGQMTPPDTCLQDAISAQRQCLANSH